MPNIYDWHSLSSPRDSFFSDPPFSKFVTGSCPPKPKCVYVCVCVGMWMWVIMCYSFHRNKLAVEDLFGMGK